MERFLGKIGMTLLICFLLIGCAGRQKTERVEPGYQGTEMSQRLDQSATATSFGHPFRMVAFVLHPVGMVLDYVIVRPIYFVVSLAPSFFGYTAEDDAALQKERETY